MNYIYLLQVGWREWDSRLKKGEIAFIQYCLGTISTAKSIRE